MNLLFVLRSMRKLQQPNLSKMLPNFSPKNKSCAHWGGGNGWDGRKALIKLPTSLSRSPLADHIKLPTVRDDLVHGKTAHVTVASAGLARFTPNECPPIVTYFAGRVTVALSDLAIICGQRTKYPVCCKFSSLQKLQPHRETEPTTTPETANDQGRLGCLSESGR